MGDARDSTVIDDVCNEFEADIRRIDRELIEGYQCLQNVCPTHELLGFFRIRENKYIPNMGSFIDFHKRFSDPENPSTTFDVEMKKKYTAELREEAKFYESR